jgi:hypothetical protein
MPLKGTRETRGKPSIRGAWLRDHMVSSNEASFNLRGTAPLSQYLARRDSQRQEWNLFHSCTEIAHIAIAINRMTRMNLTYPVSAEVLAIARLGYVDNRRLRGPVESISVNMGSPSADANESGSTGEENLPQILGSD